MQRLKIIAKYKYLIALVATFNFLLTPIHLTLSGFSPAFVIVVNYTLVILSSSLIATGKIGKLTTYIIGFPVSYTHLTLPTNREV